MRHSAEECGRRRVAGGVWHLSGGHGRVLHVGVRARQAEGEVAGEAGEAVEALVLCGME